MGNQSLKAICATVCLLACLATPYAWFADRPGAIAWGFRIALPSIALLAAGLFLKFHYRRDVAYDYLHMIARKYFNRDGFCFSFGAAANNGVCYIIAYFQNQRDQPCVGRIALRPAQGFFLSRAKIEAITFEIHCEPTAFGSVCIPLPLGEELQGKRQRFEVGASVEYPQGKGRRLRFRDGLPIRAGTEFYNGFTTAISFAGMATGTMILSRPATTLIMLPSRVAESIPDDLPSETQTLWRLGDPALEGDFEVS